MPSRGQKRWWWCLPRAEVLTGTDLGILKRGCWDWGIGTALHGGGRICLSAVSDMFTSWWWNSGAAGDLSACWALPLCMQHRSGVDAACISTVVKLEWTVCKKEHGAQLQWESIQISTLRKTFCLLMEILFLPYTRPVSHNSEVKMGMIQGQRYDFVHGRENWFYLNVFPQINLIFL